MKKSAMLILVFILIIGSCAMAHAATFEKSLNFVKFNEENDGRYAATYDAAGNITSITANDPDEFNVAASRVPIDLSKAAIDFISKNAAVLNISEPSAFKVEKLEKSNGISHILLCHFHKNKRVHGSELSLHMNSAGKVVSVSNGSLPLYDISKTGISKITPAAAVENAEKQIKCAELRGKPAVEEVISAKNKIAVEAYKVVIPSLEPLGDFVCIVNAENGNIIESYDIMAHAAHSNSGAAAHSSLKPGSTGAAASSGSHSGAVYIFNPLKCNITNEPVLNLVAKPRGLQGKWATVLNAHDPLAAPDQSGNYIYPADNTHFDEVNAYYHVDKIHDYYKIYGFTGLDRSMTVTVHYGTAYDNAFFSPADGTLSIGDGNKLNDLSKEESVIYHEYTHAVTTAMAGNIPYSAESGAMNEALSDYFACTISNDPEVGEWAMAKMHKPYIRTLVNKAHYPEDIHNEVHADSVIYSGALWDLRSALGPNADKIVHFSRNYLRGISAPTFADGLNAILTADKEANRGIGADKIKKVFEARGIKAKQAPSTRSELRNSLEFESLNGNNEALRMLNTLDEQ